MKLKRHRDPRAYLDEVEAFLTEKFEWDDLTRETFHHTAFKIRDYGSVPERLEFICDSPAAANWRLKPDMDRRPWGLRISFYGRSDVGQRHADDLSRRLRAIDDGTLR